MAEMLTHNFLCPRSSNPNRRFDVGPAEFFPIKVMFFGANICVYFRHRPRFDFTRSGCVGAYLTLIADGCGAWRRFVTLARNHLRKLRMNDPHVAIVATT